MPRIHLPGSSRLLWLRVLLLCLPSFLFAQPASEDLYGDAFLRRYIPPSYLEAWKSEALEGHVVLRFIVAKDGTVEAPRVVESTDPRFEPVALETLQQWSFEPAVAAGQPIASSLQVKVGFRPPPKKGRPAHQPPDDEQPETLPSVPARERRTPDPRYPDHWLERRVPAVVEVEFVVNERGEVAAPKVLAASHEAFVPAALLALRKWSFQPAMQGDLPVPSRHGARLEFGASEVSIERGLVLEELAAHGIKPVGAGAAPWKREPKLRRSTDPVFPYELGIAGVTGDADVAFTITTGGNVRDARVVSASHPEFGAALLAAVERWAFQPARNDDGTVAVEVVVHHHFDDPRQSAKPDARLWRLLSAGESIAPARGLDQRLRPIYQTSPAYPTELVGEQAAGEAVIEFIIDQDGMGRVPRVKSATHPAFGYAAAAAVELWCFEPPTRNDEPVDVRVSIPFNFKPPQE